VAVEAPGPDGTWLSLTYRELEARASRLAGRLRRHGVGPETVVAITAERSLDLVVGLLGILKAGGAYLPLDPEYPRDRLQYMLRDSGAPVLLVQGALAEWPPGDGPLLVLRLDDAASWSAEAASPTPPRQPPHPHPLPRPSLAAAPAVRPENLAYVIYTSGSTGRPKGTMNTHRGIVNRLLWMLGRYRLGAGDRVLQKTPAGFDVSVWELFWPLLTGARLVLAAPGGHRDSAYLLRTLGERRITYTHFVPAMLRVFLDHLEAEAAATAPARPRSRRHRLLPRLRRIMASGEALPYEVQQRCHALLGVPVDNLYGPTEAAVEVTAWAAVVADEPDGHPPSAAAASDDHRGVAGVLDGHRVAAGAPDADPASPRPLVPIGRPVANTTIHLLDHAGGQVPAGVPGELYIGGVQLARGYLGRPELTAEKFLPDPFAGLAGLAGGGADGAVGGGQRLYRSGDVARHRPDGAIEFLGRADTQVKIRGVRIELGEIEAALGRHAAVAEAVVVAAAGGALDGPRLVAYLVLAAPPPADVPALLAELRRSLRVELPEPMVPAVFMVLAALPLSANGKLDRKALPAPDGGAPAAAAGRTAARTPTEQTLAALWAELLGRDEIAAEDSFFDLGGHSLLATRLVSRLRQAFGIELPLSRVFARPTLAALAGEIAERTAAGTAAQPAGPAPPHRLTRAGAAGSAGGTGSAGRAGRADGSQADPAAAADPRAVADPAAAARLAARRAGRRTPGAPAAARRTAALTPTEQSLAGLWAELLGCEREAIGAEDSFFDLGGHSLLANRLVSRVGRAFGVELPLARVFGAPTLAALAAEIAAQSPAGRALGAATAAEPAAPPASASAPLADDAAATAAATVLSFAQERIWFLSQLAPDGAAYNMPGTLRLRGSLGAVGRAALGGALHEIVRRHQILRSAYPVAAADSGQPLQVVLPHRGLALPLVDLAELAHPAAAARRLAAELGRRPFALASGPLLRTVLLRLAADEHLLVVVLHHIVGDGWSVAIFLRELAALQAAFAAGEPSPLPELALQYADFARWQRGWLDDAALAAPLAFWRQALAGAPPRLALPLDRPRPATQSFRGARLAVPIPAPLAAALRGVARQAGATLFMALLAAFDVLLWRWSGESDLVVGVPVANRDRVEIEGLIGCFVNTLALRVELSGDPTLEQVLARVRQASLDAFAHQEMPFEKLVEALAPQRDPSAPPLFQVALAAQAPWAPPPAPPRTPPGSAPPAGEAAGLALEPQAIDIGTAKFDLTVEAEEAPGHLALAFEYCLDLFDPATMLRLAARYRRVLDALAAGALHHAAAGLDLLAAGERQQLLLEWAAGGSAAVAAERPATLHETFARQARRRPAAVALTCGDAALTWGELDRLATRLAGRLRGLGVGPEICVAVWLERSLEMVVALLGVLKSGGAYVPLDESFPRQRWERILADTGAAVLLTREGRRAALPLDLAARGVAVLCLDRGAAVLGFDRAAAVLGRDRATAAIASAERSAAGGAPPRPAAGPDNLAYVIYTSGSSGTPKGVGVVHRSVVSLMRESWSLDLGPDQVFLQVAPLAFDASTLEIWGPLLNGARLALFPPGLPDLDGLRDMVERQGVTSITLTTTLFHQLAESGLGALRPLRQLLVGGEALSPLHARRAWRELPATVLINAYGPTETTVDATRYPVRGAALGAAAGAAASSSLAPPLPPSPPPAPATGAVPIGRPIAGNVVRVCDRGGQPVPVGVAGEILIGGAGLARGYLGRPDLTAERFVPDPWSRLAAVGAVGGARLYRSGDLARWMPDGNLEFLGRIDHQVKVRGFRIEPGEIEASLARHPEVERSVVEVREAAPGDRRLVAYVVPAAGAAAAELTDTLRAALARELPAYMVPAAFVLLPALPLAMSGKLDRKALPAPVWGAPAGGAGFVAPRTPTEELVAGLWAELLAVPAVGAGDDFFALGGHSLLAVRAVARLRHALGVEIPLARLFDLPRLEDLAREIDALARRGAPPPLPLVRLASPRTALPLSFAQERMWFLDRLAPGSAAYNVPAALVLRGHLRRAALAAGLGAIVERHEVLRTTFAERDGNVVAEVAATGAVPLPLVDLSALPAGRRAHAAAELAAGEARRTFDLAAGPLLRAALLHLGGEGDDAEHRLLLTLHHIVCDGWSLDMMARELACLYRRRGARRRPPSAGRSCCRAARSIRRLRRLAARAGCAARRWRKSSTTGARQLAGPGGAPAAARICRRPPSARWLRRAQRRQPRHVAAGRARLCPRGARPAPRGDAVHGAARRLRHPAAALDGAPARRGGGGAGRQSQPARVQNLVGLFVNTLVLRLDLAGDPRSPSCWRWRRRWRSPPTTTRTCRSTAGERAGAAGTSRATAPFFQVVLALQAPAGAGPPRPRGAAGGRGQRQRQVRPVAGVSRATTAAWKRCGSIAPSSSTRRPSSGWAASCARCSPRWPGSRRRRRGGFRSCRCSTPRRVTSCSSNGAPRRVDGGGDLLHAPFERQAAERPGAVALIEWDEEAAAERTLTYGELAARAAARAAAAAAAGAGPETHRRHLRAAPSR
jgi:amino acid adenylation domain-containing protein